jgi:hypothetical protein
MEQDMSGVGRQPLQAGRKGMHELLATVKAISKQNEIEKEGGAVNHRSSAICITRGPQHIRFIVLRLA